MLTGLANLHAAELGIASWYGEGFRGRLQANGLPFDPDALTCAHWGHPFGTRLKVTNIANGQSVIVKVTDRGPAKHLRRVIDLSQASFKQIADLRLGTVRVKIEKDFTSGKSSR